MYANIALGIMMAVYVFMSVGFSAFADDESERYKSTLRHHPDDWSWVEMSRGSYEITIAYVIGTVVAIVLLSLVWTTKEKKLLYAYIGSVVIDLIVAIIIAASTYGPSTWMGGVYPLGAMLVTLAIFFVKVKGKSVYSLLR